MKNNGVIIAFGHLRLIRFEIIVLIFIFSVAKNTQKYSKTISAGKKEEGILYDDNRLYNEMVISLQNVIYES